MQQIESYIIIEFFEWIKRRESGSRDMEILRECCFQGRHQCGVYEILEPLAREFVREMDYKYPSWVIIENLEYYLNGKDVTVREYERIQAALWSNKKDSKLLASRRQHILCDMVSMPTRVAVEIEFFEWLEEKKIDSVEIIKMPKEKFEELVSVFARERNRRNSTKLMEKLFAVFRIDMLSKQYIRYSDSNIAKCLFLQLGANKAFPNFIHSYWDDLHYLSKDYLDIFYSEAELEQSGYIVKEYFHRLNVPETAIPCLVLWRETIEDALYIELVDLEENEVFQIIQLIVEMLKNHHDLEIVCEEAKTMADQKRADKSHRPITNVSVTQKAENIYGNMVGNVTNSTITSVQITKNDNKELAKEIEVATQRINEISELSPEQKQFIVELLGDLVVAKEDTDKAVCKKTFGAFMKGLGPVAEKVVSVLANLATIAGFLGIAMK